MSILKIFRQSSFFRLLLLATLLGLLYLFVLWRLQPVPARGADTPSDQFSAQRAFELLSELLVEGIPHPVESPANQRIRQQLVDQFSVLGYQVEIQATEACSLWQCSFVENIIASHPDNTNGPAVMLVAHYDSVPSGPGAADDGAGVVALLEVARILKDEAPFQNQLIFLLTDGEEVGLKGARAFVNEHELAQNVGVLINFEARGTSGASIMFETSEGNGWLIEQFAQVATKPTASSLFFEIYKILPNDTDLTIFKEGDMAGYGFAFIDSVENYHTPNDNLQNLSLKSLQHHGENALNLARHLVNADLTQTRSNNLIYHDVLSFFILRYPIWLGQILALLVTIGLILQAYFFMKNGRVTRRGMITGFGVALITMLVPLLLLVVPPNRWDPLPLPWLWITILIGAFALGLARLISKRSRPLDISISVWILWSLIALLLVLLLPGASVIFFVPATCALILHGLHQAKILPEFWAIALSTIGAAIIWFKLTALFDVALNIVVGPAIIALPLAIFATAALPLFVTNYKYSSE